MRVVIVTESLDRHNGQGRVNLELALGCLARGIDVVAVSERVDPEFLSAGGDLWQINAYLKRPALFRVWDFARQADAALTHLRRPGDVTVGNGFSLRQPHDVNVVHFVHGTWITSPLHDARDKRGPVAWYRTQFTRSNARWEMQSFDAANRIIGVSEAVREDLLTLGVDARKIDVVTNGVDLEEYKPGIEPRAKWGLPSDVPLALFVGDIRTRRKNLDTVLRALAEVPNLHLAVVGAIDHSPFPRMAIDLGVASRVHFLGFRKEIPAIMRCCDFFVLPSRYETWGLVIVEALASGLPVITAKTAAASSVVTDACGAVLAEPNDEVALARAMGRFASDLPLRQSAAAAARIAAEKHSWSKMVKRYLDVFEDADSYPQATRPTELALQN